jgi:hypothetical protein
VYLWRFLKLFGINLAKKTNFHGVVVQSLEVQGHKELGCSS